MSICLSLCLFCVIWSRAGQEEKKVDLKKRYRGSLTTSLSLPEVRKVKEKESKAKTEKRERWESQTLPRVMLGKAFLPRDDRKRGTE